jgi:hypothetical protein
LVEFEELEYLFGGDHTSYDDSAESSLNANITNTINVEDINSSTVNAMLSALLEPDEPVTSYNYIDELEGETVIQMEMGEASVMVSNPSRTLTNPNEPPQLVQNSVDGNTSGIRITLMKKPRYIHPVPPSLISQNST